jgi:hypothetical protein
MCSAQIPCVAYRFYSKYCEEKLFTDLFDEISKLKRRKKIRRMAAGKKGGGNMGSAGHAARSTAKRDA